MVLQMQLSVVVGAQIGKGRGKKLKQKIKRKEARKEGKTNQFFKVFLFPTCSTVAPKAKLILVVNHNRKQTFF